MDAAVRDQKHPDDRLIDALGGTVAVARLCRVRSQAVSQWRRDGIPRARRMYLNVVRPDVVAAEPCAQA